MDSLSPSLAVDEEAFAFIGVERQYFEDVVGTGTLVGQHILEGVGLQCVLEELSRYFL